MVSLMSSVHKSDESKIASFDWRVLDKFTDF